MIACTDLGLVSASKRLTVYQRRSGDHRKNDKCHDDPMSASHAGQALMQLTAHLRWAGQTMPSTMRAGMQQQCPGVFMDSRLRIHVFGVLLGEEPKCLAFRKDATPKPNAGT